MTYKFFKSPDGKPYAIEPDFVHTLPDGCVEITEEESNALSALVSASSFSAADRENEKRQMYMTESDPLFFKWQRGEGTKEQWLEKVAEIKARWPL